MKVLIEQNPILQENTILVKQLRSDLDAVELTVTNNTKKIEEGNLVIKRNTEQLIPLVPLAEDFAELSDKVKGLLEEARDLQTTDTRYEAKLSTSYYILFKNNCICCNRY